MNDIDRATGTILCVVPMEHFAGRWHELERYGWYLALRTWLPDRGWACLFRRAE